MPVRTGKEYIERLQEQGPEVYLHGERVKDVTTHPALRNGVRTLAHLYDMQHDPDLQDEMTYVSPTTGDLDILKVSFPGMCGCPSNSHSMVKEYVAAQDGIVSEYPNLAGTLHVLTQLIERISERVEGVLPGLA
ncbi:MAG: hypothetical protein IIC84_07310 [Chloroflexi bacterium]|nr:hypothetical protein [Chloroflexota bacterium]